MQVAVLLQLRVFLVVALICWVSRTVLALSYSVKSFNNIV